MDVVFGVGFLCFLAVVVLVFGEPRLSRRFGHDLSDSLEQNIRMGVPTAKSFRRFEILTRL